jgi:Asp-tRNA(Asn)/Glu-tRNA(Gln) amidotransferase B subunit
MDWCIYNVINKKKMSEHEWTFPPELLAEIIQDVLDDKITRKEGKMKIRGYLDEKYPDARKKLLEKKRRYKENE